MQQCDSAFLLSIHTTRHFPEQLTLTRQKYHPLLAWEEENEQYLLDQSGFEEKEIETTRNINLK